MIDADDARKYRTQGYGNAEVWMIHKSQNTDENMNEASNRRLEQSKYNYDDNEDDSDTLIERILVGRRSWFFEVAIVINVATFFVY